MLSINEVAEQLIAGAVGVIPTDTVYGLVCSAHHPDAIRRLYALKHRENKPGTIVAANVDQLVELGIPRRYLKVIEQYWPNPISVVIPVGQKLEALHLGKGSLAVRVPKNDALSNLLAITGPLLTTSANNPGEPTASTIAAAKAYFSDTVDFYVDGGDLENHAPSTIIRVVDDAIEVLRQGAVHISEDGQIV